MDNGQTVQLNEYTKDVHELRPDGQKVKVNFDIRAVGVYDSATQDDIMVSSGKIRLLVLGESGSCGIYAGISDLSLLYPDHPKLFLNQGGRLYL